jgi:uncharacterized repeat protein (TIGR03837 family)
MQTGGHWDIFCRVIDNFGDIGVCWRLACDLATRGVRVRLWVDDASALQWMAPTGHPGVQVLPWSAADEATRTGEVTIEAFGCELEAGFVEAMRRAQRPPVWINLEYLSAEAWVERSHALPSPQRNGLLKHFFFPGFTPATGGLLREPGLAGRQASFDRAAWLARHGVAWRGESLVSLFCYEPVALEQLLEQLAQQREHVQMLVTSGRARRAVEAAMSVREAGGQPLPQVVWLPLLSQSEYDHLLWACDLNFVRGEDSLVRALWAGKPLVWQLYPQSDQAHHVKLQAWLDAVQAPPSLCDFHAVWNGLAQGPLPAFDAPGWAPAARAAHDRLVAQPDLASRLLQFVAKNRLK